MMAYQSIVLHLKSITEAQTVCLLVIWYAEYGAAAGLKDERRAFEQEGLSGSAEFVLWFLLAHHVISYFTGFYRERDVRYHGKPDVLGVPTAPNSALVLSIEQFLACLLVGYALRYLIDEAD